jgi:hypothetical protein
MNSRNARGQGPEDKRLPSAFHRRKEQGLAPRRFNTRRAGRAPSWLPSGKAALGERHSHGLKRRRLSASQ